MKKRLSFLGALLIALFLIYLNWVLKNNWMRSAKYWIAIPVCLYGLIFPDKIKLKRDENKQQNQEN